MQNIIFFIPNIERGGIEKNLVILSEYLSNQNYSIEIICGKISKEIKKKINKKITILKCNKFLNLNFMSPRILNSINCFIFFLFSYKAKPQQIILSMQDHPFAIVAAKIKRIPCVLRIANHPYSSLKYYNNSINFFIKINIKKIFYRFASGIICNSKSSTIFFKNIFKKKIINIYNPIKIDLSKAKNKKVKNNIISVGRLQNQKNFSGLIKSFSLVVKYLKNTKLIIIGSGGELKDLKDLTVRLGLSNKIEFIKYQNADKQIKSSKLFVLNSLWEGLPNILIEAQMLKTPILSTNCLSGPNEILKNGKLGNLTAVDDAQMLAKKIIYIFNNYNDAKKKAKLAFKNLERFNLKLQCKKYELFLKKFI